MQVASSALTVLGKVQEGRAANAAGKAEAARQRQAAIRERALAQRKAEEARRATRRAQSDALARFAARGGGADPTTRTLLARLQGEGELRAFDALATGEQQARDAEHAGALARFDGKSKRRSANLGALAEGLSFAGKYGPAVQTRLEGLGGPEAGSAEWRRKNWGYM